ncbi:MAG: hypothetical protein J5I41_05390 [Saprospiraceae bacterium]|nr:hypothetical protein [Saprospiraceae bacterium]
MIASPVRIPWKSFFLFSLAVLIGVIIPTAWEAFPLSRNGIFIQWCFFFLITALILWLGERMVNHRNPHLFTGVTLGSALAKLVLGVLLLFVYQKYFPPRGRGYLLMFFLLYASFAAYELYALQKLVRGKETSRK